jgi:hypothetical protein
MFVRTVGLRISLLSLPMLEEHERMADKLNPNKK